MNEITYPYGIRCQVCNHFMHVLTEDQETCYCAFCNSEYKVTGYRQLETIKLGTYDITKKRLAEQVQGFKKKPWNVINGHIYKVMADLL